jgi:hypothetical protein
MMNRKESPANTGYPVYTLQIEDFLVRDHINFFLSFYLVGRAIAQVVSCWLPTAAARVETPV